MFALGAALLCRPVDAGRPRGFTGRPPKRIKGELFAFDTVDVDPLLGELEKYGFIMRYEAEGIQVIQIPKFDLHQHPHHKEPSSDLPSPKSPGFCGDESVKHGVKPGPLLNPYY